MSNYILYNGPSVLTGDPIIAVMTGIDRPSENEKTGNVAQVWVLRADMHPIVAVKEKKDDAVCGTCPLRKNICYVNLGHGVSNIWKSWMTNPKQFELGFPPRAKTKRRAVRLTAYGDPAALPTSVVRECVERFKTSLGYTHLWRDRPELKEWLMASVESPELAAEAQKLGWRTYRIRGDKAEPRLKGEALCPFEATKLQCIDCGACNGTRGPFSSNLVVTVHGIGGRIQKFNSLAA